MVRFRSGERLEQIRAWVGEARARARRGTLSVEDVWRICEDALRCLKVRMRRHRFPGVALEGAIEAGIQSLHYHMVMRAVVEPERRG